MAPKESGLGVVNTLEQVAKVLGFHDLSSFTLTGIFLVIALAFSISSVIFFIKKRRERRSELRKIVDDVQGAELKRDKENERVERSKISPLGIESQVHAKAEPEQEKAALIEPASDAGPRTARSTTVVRVQDIEPVSKETEAIGGIPQGVAAPPMPMPEEAAPKGHPSAHIDEAPSPKEGGEEPKANAEQIPSIQKELGLALKNTRGGFIAKLAQLFGGGKALSEEDFEEMEAILFTADIGVKTAQKLLEVMRERADQTKNFDKNFLRSVLKEEMQKILESVKPHVVNGIAAPRVLMFVGVNGAGKTTSIGKLGARLKRSGKSVLFGAGDTFRAAAVKQLAIWGERVGAEVISGKENGDSASVLFDAIHLAQKNGVDVVLCDTAGRLHNKTDLMDELGKVARVVGKAQPGAPHETFLVIDATMGQNAIAQAREFAQATPITGIVLSKLDGTAKGGVAIGIVDELGLPIRYIGIGEKESDLKEFDAKQFVDALFDEA